MMWYNRYGAGLCESFHPAAEGARRGRDDGAIHPVSRIVRRWNRGKGQRFISSIIARFGEER